MPLRYKGKSDTFVFVVLIMNSIMIDIVENQPETILVTNSISDQSANGDVIVTLSGPSFVVVKNPKTSAFCMTPFGQNAIATFEGNSFKVKHLVFSYDSTDIPYLNSICGIQLNRKSPRKNMY